MSLPTPNTPGYGTFRGRTACDCLIAWLPAYEAELQRRGILAGDLRIYQLTGDYAASGSTHSQGGAFDVIDLPGGEEVWVARQMGADGTWLRPYNWDHEGGMAHVHGVLTGCPHNGPARYQIDEVRAGRNGLASYGSDTGPRPLSGRTWREGIAWARQQEEDDMALSDDDKVWIKATIEKAAADALKTQLGNGLTLRNTIFKIAKKVGVPDAKE